MNYRLVIKCVCFFTIALITCSSFAQPSFNYSAAFSKPEKHYVDIELHIQNVKTTETHFLLPVWSPGYYEILDFPKNIVDFKVTSQTNQPISRYKNSKKEWVVANNQNSSFKITYRYFADKKSVAESNIDTERAFLMPNNMFKHVKNHWTI